MSSLQNFKYGKTREIRMRTEELIRKGFDFDANHFDLEFASRQKWLALKTLEASLAWPVMVSTSIGEYSLSQANLDVFLAAALAIVQGYKDSGRALRMSVEACVDIPSVFAIEDLRA